VFVCLRACSNSMQPHMPCTCGGNGFQQPLLCHRFPTLHVRPHAPLAVTPLDPLQGRLILYSPDYRPAKGNGSPINLPVLKPATRQSAYYLQYWNRVRGDPDPKKEALAGRQSILQGRKLVRTSGRLSRLCMP